MERIYCTRCSGGMYLQVFGKPGDFPLLHYRCGTCFHIIEKKWDKKIALEGEFTTCFPPQAIYAGTIDACQVYQLASIGERYFCRLIKVGEVSFPPGGGWTEIQREELEGRLISLS